jgi:hypothetical protein
MYSFISYFQHGSAGFDVKLTRFRSSPSLFLAEGRKKEASKVLGLLYLGGNLAKE